MHFAFITKTLLGLFICLIALWHIKSSLARSSPLLSPRLDKPIRIIVTESSGSHSEVLAALLFTLSRLKQKGLVEYTVYWLNRYPRYGIQDIWRPYHPEAIGDLNDLHQQFGQDPLKVDPFDVLIQTTAMGEELQLYREFQDATGRPFRLVTTAHHADKDAARGLLDSHQSWLERGQLSYLTMSGHVRDALRRRYAWYLSEKAQANLSLPPILAFPPVFDVQYKQSKKRAGLSKVAIQGSVTARRRNYNGVLQRLAQSVHENPSLWGYKWQNDKYESDSDSKVEPFKLYILGSNSGGERLNVPAEISNLVEQRHSLQYREYLDVLHDCDLLLPAFSDVHYYEDDASSSIAAALLAKIPILGTRILAEAYTYIPSESLIIHDDSEHPIDILAAMRLSGFIKGKLSSEAASERIYEENDRVLMSALLGAP